MHSHKTQIKSQIETSQQGEQVVQINQSEREQSISKSYKSLNQMDYA
jgi:hypothetical protein